MKRKFKRERERERLQFRKNDSNTGSLMSPDSEVLLKRDMMHH